MSVFDDDAGEMSQHRLITDLDAEAILSGTSPNADFHDLVSFVGEVRRIAASTEVTASPALLTMWSSDFSNEKGDLSATAASNVTGPASQVAGLPKRRTRMPIPQFVAGLSLAGKLALGTGLAAAAGTGAAATGSLPDPVQHAVAAVVRTITPFEVPDSPGRNQTPPTLVTNVGDPTPTSNFGGQVSNDAKGNDGTPGVDGATISSEAKARQDAKPCASVPTSSVPTAPPAAPGCAPDSAGKPTDVVGQTPAATAPSVPATPPVSAPPVSAPPVSVPPVSAPPVSAPSVSTPSHPTKP